MAFSIASDDPFEVLEVLRVAPSLDLIEHVEILEPKGVPARRLDAPFGFVHPSHRAWVAGVLGLTQEDIDALLSGYRCFGPNLELTVRPEGTLNLDTTGGAGLHRALAEAQNPAAEALRRAGIEPKELVAWHIPVPSGAERLNASLSRTSDPLLSPINAELVALWSLTQSVMRRLQMPQEVGRLLAFGQAVTLHYRLDSLIQRLRGRGPLFHPYPEINERGHLTGYPLRRQPGVLVLPPPEPSPSFSDETTADWLCEPKEVLLHESYAVLGFNCALVQLDLETGAINAEPMRRSHWSHVTEAGHVCFAEETRAGFGVCIYDLAKKSFVNEAPAVLPQYMFAGVTESIHVMDVDSGALADVPGPDFNSVDAVVSPCGDFVWLCLKPTHDEFGIISVSRGERILQPWGGRVPVPSPPQPSSHSEDPDDGECEDDDPWDETPRAFVCMAGGHFRYFYGDALYEHGEVLAKFEGVLCAGFDRSGQRLIVADRDTLRIFRVVTGGAVELLDRWSLAPLRQHLTSEALRRSETIAFALGPRTPEPGDEPKLRVIRMRDSDLFGTVGTVGGLARMQPEELLPRFTRRFLDVDSVTTAASLIDLARRVQLPSSLRRL